MLTLGKANGTKRRINIFVFLLVLDDDHYINARASKLLDARGSIDIATLALEFCIQVANYIIIRFISHDT